MNRLLECCLPIISLAEEFCINYQQLSLEFRDQLIQEFFAFDLKAKEMGLEGTDAKYALAAFMDELVLHHEWPGRLSWMAKPLQVELFGEHLAGEGFFKCLEQLRQHPQRTIDTLEIYYICLVLGFAGVYHLRGIDHLQSLVLNLADQIQLVRGKQNVNLEILDQQTLKPRKWVKFEIPRKWMVVSTVLLSLLLYGSAQARVEQQTLFLVQQLQDKENPV